jgi:hypothetical protein
MDFFHGLDNMKYSTFKTSMLNGWSAKAMEPPHSVNTIYRLAGSWVKPSTRVEGGMVATYVTLEEKNKRKGKKQKQ